MSQLITLSNLRIFYRILFPLVEVEKESHLKGDLSLNLPPKRDNEITISIKFFAVFL